MTQRGSGLTNRHAIQQPADCLALGCIVEQRGCTMRIDVINVGRGNLRALKSSRHRLSRSDARWFRLRDMKVVGGNTVTDDFGEDRSPALASEVEIFQGQDCSTFTEHHTRPMAIKRPAFLWC